MTIIKLKCYNIFILFWQLILKLKN